MVDKELLDFIMKDDGIIIAEAQLQAAKKQVELLETIKEQTKPSELNNWTNVLRLDLRVTHDSYEVFRWYEGHPDVNSVVIPSQLIDYEYEIEPGKRVSIEAGLITEISGHEVKELRVSNTDTTDDVMDIILSGYDPAK